MNKIKIHIRNNHWKEGFLPCDEEGEKNNTITKQEFEKRLSQYPEIKDKIEYLIDWDDDNFVSSMKSADVLLGWQFPTDNLKDIAQKYDGFGKKIKLRHLSKDCHKLLSKTGQLVVDSDDDPDYSLAVDYSVNLKIFNK